MTEVRSRPAANRMPVTRSAVIYVAVGLTSYAVDAGVLVLLHRVLDVGLAAATTAAFATAFVANFALNRRFSFAGGHGRLGAQFGRYLLLGTISYALTLALVLGLAWLGLHFLLAKTTAVGCSAGVNFLLCRSWVFRGVRV
ncbi:GtrA family protein [Nonomuraea africana]|uniref:Flippase GtrA n=1 Tax=Nonomuraea africana TaxID=46171 RepID=A0ABR9KTW5_9ACTN|nr:GtrA family protein [Nonomuraea africana]MBE1565478.1 putative flippase GtrA [Nonomuraea africana]